MPVKSCHVSFSIDGVERWTAEEIHSREDLLGACLRMISKGMFKHLPFECIGQATKKVIACVDSLSGSASGVEVLEWEYFYPGKDDVKLFVLDIEYDWENC